MGHEDDRQALLAIDALKTFEKSGLGGGVEPVRGLIQNEQPGTSNQGPRDERALALTARKSPIVLRIEAAQIDMTQRFRETLRLFPSGDPKPGQA